MLVQKNIPVSSQTTGPSSLSVPLALPPLPEALSLAGPLAKYAYFPLFKSFLFPWGPFVTCLGTGYLLGVVTTARKTEVVFLRAIAPTGSFAYGFQASLTCQKTNVAAVWAQ